jgi:hypothetical protein
MRGKMPSKVYTKDLKMLITPAQLERIRKCCLEKGYKLKKQMSPSEFCRIVVMKYVKEMEDEIKG